jgi:hypothetical protein
MGLSFADELSGTAFPQARVYALVPGPIENRPECPSTPTTTIPLDSFDRSLTGNEVTMP